MNALSNSLSNFTLFENDTLCEYVDESYESLMSMKNITIELSNNPSSITFASVIICTSIISLAMGAKLFRPISSIISGLFAFFFVYKLSNNSSNLSCDARVVISTCIGILFAILTGCLIKVSLFIIGAASFSGFTHLIFIAFPELHTIGDMPEILDLSVLYWGCIILAGILGGLLLRCYQRLSLEIMTSVIGGVSLAYGLHCLIVALQVTVSHYVFFGIAIVSSICGILFQRKTRKGLCKVLCQKKENKEKNESKNDEKV